MDIRSSSMYINLFSFYELFLYLKEYQKLTQMVYKIRPHKTSQVICRSTLYTALFHTNSPAWVAQW